MNLKTLKLLSDLLPALNDLTIDIDGARESCSWADDDTVDVSDALGLIDQLSDLTERLEEIVEQILDDDALRLIVERYQTIPESIHDWWG